MNARRWLNAPLIISLLLVIAVLGYFALTEVRHYPQHKSPNSTVLRNPYHAAQQLLERHGQPSRQILSAAALFPLPDTATTLIINSRRSSLTKAQVDNLLRWVNQGGRLILAARSEPDALATDHSVADLLFATLGIHSHSEAQSPLDDDPLEQLLSGFRPFAELFFDYCLHSENEDARAHCQRLVCEAPAQAEPAYWQANPQQPGQWRGLQLSDRFSLDWSAEDAEISGLQLREKISNRSGNQLLQLQLGDGRITALTGFWLWDNQHLHHFDHAWLLRQLSGDQPLWWVRAIAVPPLPQWLWQQAAPLISALLLLLLLWLWRRIPRRGPLLSYQDDSRADYLGHLHASGYFLWRTGQADSLLAGLREQARRQLEQHHLDADKALASSAARLGIAPAALQQALTANPQDREQFLTFVNLLQHLRSQQ